MLVYDNVETAIAEKEDNKLTFIKKEMTQVFPARLCNS